METVTFKEEAFMEHADQTRKLVGGEAVRTI